jgi:hypothetical protein
LILLEFAPFRGKSDVNVVNKDLNQDGMNSISTRILGLVWIIGIEFILMITI